jgi:hypothetical protein
MSEPAMIRKLCQQCRDIVADWLRGEASCAEEGGEIGDTLMLACPSDGRRTLQLGEAVSRGT